MPRWLLGALVFLACSPAPQASPVAAPASLTYRVVRELPHDESSYTQGLTFDQGRLFESAGQYGSSSLREVDPETGAPKRQFAVPDQYFAEGMAVVGDKIYQLTYREGQCLVYDKSNFKLLRSFRYPGEGWGLTYDGQSLWMSDGSDELRVLVPATFQELRRLKVTDRGQPVRLLNELEWVEGQLFANVYMTDRIARIDPASGRVTGWLDLAGILNRHELPASSRAEVLNGIAYEPDTRRLLVTGKYWPKMFEIVIEEKP